MITVWSTEGLVPNDRYNLRVISFIVLSVKGSISNMQDDKWMVHISLCLWKLFTCALLFSINCKCSAKFMTLCLLIFKNQQNSNTVAEITPNPCQMCLSCIV